MNKCLLTFFFNHEMWNIYGNNFMNVIFSGGTVPVVHFSIPSVLRKR